KRRSLRCSRSQREEYSAQKITTISQVPPSFTLKVIASSGSAFSSLLDRPAQSQSAAWTHRLVRRKHEPDRLSRIVFVTGGQASAGALDRTDKNHRSERRREQG